MGFAADLIIIIMSGFVGGLVLYRFRMPLLLGYIFAGVIIGPYALGIIPDIKNIEFLSEIGVALLLFSIGLDFSFRELRQVGRIAVIGTPIQIALTIGYGYAIGRIFGFDAVPSLLLGAVMSLSSTMVVIKTLMNQELMGTLSSRVMIGILIVQDLAAIPMMIIIPQMNNIQDGLPLLGLAVLKAVGFLVIIFFVGTRAIPFILKVVARWNSRELFLLAVTTIGLGIGYVTHLAGLSFAFGAFVAGMVLNESDYSHQALSDIIPLRDILVLFFFTSIGMLFDPLFMLDNLRVIMLITLAVLIGKGILFAGISRAFGYRNVIPIALALGTLPDRRVFIRAHPHGYRQEHHHQGAVPDHALGHRDHHGRDPLHGQADHADLFHQETVEKVGRDRDHQHKRCRAPGPRCHSRRGPRGQKRRLHHEEFRDNLHYNRAGTPAFRVHEKRRNAGHLRRRDTERGP